MRHIHWRSWARTGKPIVKEFADEFFVRHALVLDTFSDHQHSEAFEEAVSVAASFACTIQTQESLLDLLFVGAEAYCFTAGRGLAHADQMLEILASVPVCTDKPFANLEHLVLNHANVVSGCICVLLAWDAGRREFVEKLKALGVPVLVVVVLPSAPGQPLDPGPMRDEAEPFSHAGGRPNRARTGEVMKSPPLLAGAALLFWGWQSDLLIEGAIMAVILESARFIKARWELSNEDFSRIWTFCALLLLATAAYGFTAGSGPASLGDWVTSGRVSAGNAVGNATTKTAVLLIRWLPMAFFLFVAAGAYSDRDGIPLETISLILRRRWRKALKAGQPAPPSRSVNVAYPFFVVCLFAACGHPATEGNSFFWGLGALLAWAFWLQRSRRFARPVWAGTMGLAILMAYAGQRGMVQLRHTIDQYNPDWFWPGRARDLMRWRTTRKSARSGASRLRARLSSAWKPRPAGFRPHTCARPVTALTNRPSGTRAVPRASLVPCSSSRSTAATGPWSPARPTRTR